MGFFFNVGTAIDQIFNPEEYSDKGSSGEQFTYRVLKKSFPSGKILRNVYIQKKNGKSTEIDMLAVNKKGIFVIESKNYGGYIYGKEEDKNWTQVLNKNAKNKFYNPVLQNNTHIESLKFALSDFQKINYFNIVVFGERCTLKIERIASFMTYVIAREFLEQAIDKISHTYRDCISPDQQKEIIELLSKTSRPDETVKEKHIQQIKDDLSKCPFCGGELVERQSKKDGNKFLGCKNFPKCRFTRQCP